MAKYKKRPIVIDAEQFWPDNPPWPDGVQVYVAGPFALDKEPGEFDFAVIETLEGTMRVSPGDFVITGVKGERYPCRPDIFEQTYELVETQPIHLPPRPAIRVVALKIEPGAPSGFAS